MMISPDTTTTDRKAHTMSKFAALAEDVADEAATTISSTIDSPPVIPTWAAPVAVVEVAEQAPAPIVEAPIVEAISIDPEWVETLEAEAAEAVAESAPVTAADPVVAVAPVIATATRKVGQISWVDAAVKVLAAGAPLHTKAILAGIVDGGFRDTDGKTPRATLARDLRQEAAKSNGRVVQTAPSTFELRPTA